MSDSRVAGGLDRLPWLHDEPKAKAPAAKRGGRDLTAWAAAAILLVGGVSFWFGTRTNLGEEPTQTAPSSATVAVPVARPAEPQVPLAPQPEVQPVRAPEVRPAPEPQVRITPPPRRGSSRIERPASEATVLPKEETPSVQPVTAALKPKAAAPTRLTPWPPRVVAGASGRLVQIGAFGSVHQAKVGWRYMVRAYPAVAHLPAVVRPDRNSRGRVFYRFRIGTTSQAHSEVLCQRMQTIQLSCAVVGLPWKAKVER